MKKTVIYLFFSIGQFAKNVQKPTKGRIAECGIIRQLVNMLFGYAGFSSAYLDARNSSRKWLVAENLFLMFAFLFHTSISQAQVAGRVDSTLKDTISKEYSLHDVTVKGTNITHYSDKDVVRITREMRKGSFTTGEMLGKVPGMIYSRIDKSLSYYGETNVKILVDSVEKSADYILGLHHMRFDKIDIIPYPKGKYEGFSAVINLHTKVDYEGYEGNTSGDAEFFPEDRNVKGSLFGDAKWKESFTYTKNKWNFVFNYNGDFDHQERNNQSVIQYPLNDYTESVIDNPDGGKNYKNFERGHVIQSSIDYQFDKRNSISVAYRLDLQAIDQYNHRTVLQSDVKEAEIDTIKSDLVHRDNGYRQTFALYYRGGRGDWNYTADVNFVLNGYDSKNRLVKTSGYINEDNRNNKMYHSLARIEVNRRLLNNKMYAALGYNNFWKHYVQKRIENGAELTNYTLRQNMLWAYTSYNFTDATSLNASGSLILNNTKDRNLKDNYLSYAGGLGLYRRIGKDDWIRMDYTCKVNNPNINQVTSYGQFTDSLQWNGGNPLLRSAISHDLSIRYHFLEFLTANAVYNYQPRTFSDITETRDGYLENGLWNRYAATTTQNAKYSNLGLSLYYEQKIKHLNLSANVDYHYAKGKYDIYEHAIGYWAGNCMAEYDFEKLGLYASCAYNLNYDYNVWAQGVNKVQVDMVWVYIQQTLLKERLNIGLSYVLPVHFTSGKNISTTDSPAKYTCYQNYSLNKLSSNNFELTVSYRFNGGKSVREYKREMSEEK